ncbi:hypothetical protein GGTG_02333 [Gaeumannomyces tritici R3-111a-1]|uniref:Uncharacterized protein n=1 Tax=Gaeumannomyces tritici (strain R3-111a-1) TaxID=644352 RepID=J3NM29_GAET3|nr:hypothetical protein GGTG_02333 [Gaeumannomyces tritici R3-111a-1]EJT82360.1 hypothetical protein GGTG_02333 [Gaeumannomyces tritici R3-111a-1]
MKENDPLLLKWRALGPSAPPHERRELFSAIVRAEIDADALTGDESGGLALSIESKIDALTSMAAHPPPDLAAFEQGFHDLCARARGDVLRAAAVGPKIGGDDGAQHQQGLGMAASNIGGDGRVAALSNGARAWADMPFLAEDFAAAFAGWQAMPRPHRAGLAPLLGRLLAVGVGDAGLAVCALVVMRNALEEAPVAGAGAVAPDLEPLRHLIRHAAARLLRLSDDAAAVMPGPFAAELSGLGRRARDAGVTVPPGSRLGPERWAFWNARLFEIIKESEGESRFVDDARASLLRMWAEEDIAWGPERSPPGRWDELRPLLPDVMPSHG